MGVNQMFSEDELEAMDELEAELEALRHEI
jgi:hypothetical protein